MRPLHLPPSFLVAYPLSSRNEASKPLKKILITLLKVGISAAILGYLVWDAHRDQAFSNLWHQPKRWGLLAGALAVCGTAVLLTLVRWCYLVRALGLPLRMRDALRIGFLGYLFNLAPMGIVGGDLLKGVMLARHQRGKYAEALASVFMDRAVGLYLLCVVASLGILVAGFWRDGTSQLRWVCHAVLVVTAISTAGVVLVLLPDYARGRTTRWIGRIPYVGPPLLQIVDAVQMYRRRMSVLGAAAVMSVAVHSLFVVGVSLIAAGLYDQVHSLGRHFVLSPLGALTQVIPIPAGHVEASLHWLYAQVPLPNGQMLAADEGLMVALGYRIITVLIAAVGICYYLASRAEVAEVLHAAERASEQHAPDPGALVSAAAA